MKRSKSDPLLANLQSFFESYLRQIRGASPHTLRSYRDSLRLFFLYLAGQKKSSIRTLRVEDIQAPQVLSFLAHIERQRTNQVTTRNCRLAAIRCFAEHLLREDFTRAEQYRRILSISAKKSKKKPVTYLEPEEVRKLIAGIGRDSTSSWLRDRALILFLYNTGARISEALAVRAGDFHLEKPRQVRLMGKGNKERYCPLWAETAQLLRKLIGSRSSNDPVFCSYRNEQLSRDGAAYILRKYVQKLSVDLPGIEKKRITLHTLRHSCAVALLQSGVDLTVIRDYLGHASIATTGHYITANIEMKQKVLQAFWKRSGLDSSKNSSWSPPSDLLKFLESL